MDWYLNHLKGMNEHRWPKKVLTWDLSLKAEGWADQVTRILTYANIDNDLEDDVIVDLDVLRARLLRSNKTSWLLEAHSQTKLRTFVQIYNELEPKAIIQANLPCNHRSLLSKLKLGVLPLAIETGRWKDTPLELRTWKVCDKGFLEDEFHFLLHCDAYVQTQTEFFAELENQSGELV